MAPPRRSAPFETPDLSHKHNYRVNRLPLNFELSVIQPAKRFLRLIQDRETYDFLRTKAEFEASDDDQWKPRLQLGSGAWGHVGCWVRRDEEGSVVDEIAVKQIDEPARATGRARLKGFSWDSQDQEDSLLTEAVIQRQLNLSSNENLVHLRAYKFFHEQPKGDLQPPLAIGTRSWRFYLELAPYGDLFFLAMKYHYWGQYLPEPFLWHVFDSLTQAAIGMRDCEKRVGISPGQQVRVTDEVVNFDIKNENIFLGYPSNRKSDDDSNRGGSKNYDYPTIKLGDFGLSHFTGPDDDDEKNPWTYIGEGTYGCMPPEQVFYGYCWPWPSTSERNEIFDLPPDEIHDQAPFYRSRDKYNGLDSNPDKYAVGAPVDRNNLYKSPCVSTKFSQKLHVWAIGKVMHDLMSLQPPEYYWDISTDSYLEFRRNGQHQVPLYDQRPFKKISQTRSSPYSKKLIKLVWDCLRPIAAQRPDVAALKLETGAGMREFDDKWYDGCEQEMPEDVQHRGVNHPKLFYENSTILDMPEGSNNTDDSAYEHYEYMRQEIQKNPDLQLEWPDFDRTIPYLFGNQTYKERWDAEYSYWKTDFQSEFKLVNGQLRRRSEAGVSDMQSDASSNDDDGTGYLAVPPDVPNTGHGTAQNGSTGHHDGTTQNGGRTDDDGTTQSTAAQHQTETKAQDTVTAGGPPDVPADDPATDPVDAPAPLAPPAPPTTTTAATNTGTNTTTEPHSRMTAGLGARKASIKTDDPSDSEYEIVVRELKNDVHKNSRRRSYYRLRQGRKENKKKMNAKLKRKKERFTKLGRSTYEDARRRNGH